MLLPRIPKKAIKGFSTRKEGTHKIKMKLKTYLVDMGSHHKLEY
jgi:hypothetical protein